MRASEDCRVQQRASAAVRRLRDINGGYRFFSRSVARRHRTMAAWATPSMIPLAPNCGCFRNHWPRAPRRLTGKEERPAFGRTEEQRAGRFVQKPSTPFERNPDFHQAL